MRALVTRPRDDAGTLAALLQSRGIEPVLEPLLTIHFVPDGADILAPLLDGAQAVLFTSANGVRAFAAASAHRNLAAFAVGDATATAARDAGFVDIASAGGDVADLAVLVGQQLNPEAGALVHAAASEVAGDLAGALAAQGFELRRAVLYESIPAERLSDASAAALADGTLDLALFFSPRTAELFVRLATAAGLEGACRAVAAVALSPAVSARLEPLVWRAVHVAETPTLASLLEATDRAAAEGALSHGSGGAPMTDGRSDRPEAPRPASRPRRRAAWEWLAALVAAIAIIGSAPYWVPLLPWGQEQAPQLAAVQARLDAADADRRTIEQRVAQLAAQQRPAATPPAPAPPNAAALDALAHRIDALEGHAANPATGAAAAPDSAALDALTQRVAALEQRAPTDVQPVADALQKAGARLDALEARLKDLAAAAPGVQSETGDIAGLAALAGLRAALASGAPYRDELTLVATLGGGDQKTAAAVETLSHDAATGLPSRAFLAARFRAETAPAIRRAAAPEAADDGSLAARALARVTGLVTIRRIGDGATASDDPAAAALAALDRDDLAAALAALKPLAGAAAEAAKPWRELAQRRVDAEAAAADLARQADARLAAHGDGR